MAKRKKGLGIDALLGKINPDIDRQEKQEVVSQLSNTINKIPLINIEVNPFQPRVDFDPIALQELSDSIQVHGLIQPITVRHLHSDQFQLISGERRLRASKLAGLTEVPAYVRIANDQEMIEMALIENIQRQELNSVEIALTYQRLMEECQLTHDKLAERVGKGRTTITNYLRLLKLPPELQNGLKEGKITMGHARALINIPDIALQMSVYKDVVEKSLSVRQTEELASRYKQNSPNQTTANKPKLPTAHLQVQRDLTTLLSTRVALKRKANGKGQIVIHFEDDEDLNRILDKIEQED